MWARHNGLVGDELTAQQPTALGEGSAGSLRNAVCAWAAAALFAAVAGRFAPLTAPAEFAALLAGGAVTGWALGARAPGIGAVHRRAAPESLGGRGWLAWIAVLLVCGVIEVYSLTSATPLDHPTLSALSRPLLAPPDHRELGYLLWLACGVWVARR